MPTPQAAVQGFSPAPRAAAVGPEHSCSCTKAWWARARQRRLPLAPEQLSSSGACARWHVCGTRVRELEARREVSGKAAPGALALICAVPSRCAGTHLCCALLSKELPAGNISLNASLDYPLLLDSPDRGKKKALSLLWNIWIQEYLVPAKSQTSCGNTHK